MKKITKILFFLHLVLVGNTAFAVSYYVSFQNGSDSNNGTSQTTPWKTLTKVNTMMSSFVPGDQILFARGETWFGQLNIQKSGTASNPIYFGAYGSASTKPTITGFTSLTSWSSVAGYPNVYKCILPVTMSEVNVFTYQGQLKALGRWPNYNSTDGGYRFISNGANNGTFLTDTSLSSLITPNFIGGEIVVLCPQYVLNRNKILSQQTLTQGLRFDLEPANSYPIWWSRGYFIQNHINTLDVTGEWCFNQSENAIYVFSNVNPSNTEIKIATINNLIINHWNFSNFTIENFNLEGSNQTLISFGGSCSNINIKNCEFSNAVNAISVYQSNTSAFKNNYVHDITNNGIYFVGNNNLIDSNIIENIGILPGMGRSGDNQYIGIQAASNNSSFSVTISNNKINNIGYNGISQSGQRFIVEKNIISNCGLSKSDGGGIYLNNMNQTNQLITNRRISNNIIYDTYGTHYLNGLKKDNSFGIYLDVVTSYVEVKNNTIFSNSSGLKVNDRTNNNVIENNLFYNNINAGFNAYLDYNTSVGPLLYTNFLNNFSNNTIYLGDNLNQTFYSFFKNNGISGINNIGNINRNYFFAPKNQVLVFRTNEAIPNTYIKYSFNVFKQRYVHDQDSYFCSVKYDANQSLVNNTYFLYNTQNTTQNFSIPSGIYINRYGKSVCLNNATGVNLEPFTSDIFTKVSEVTTDTITETVEVSTLAGWTFYAPASNLTNILFAIEKTPAITNGNTATFNASVFVTTNGCIATFPNHIKTQTTEATLSGRNFCNFKINSTTKPNGLVNIRWFISEQDLVDLNNGAIAFKDSQNSGTISPTLFLKKNNSKMQLPQNIREDGIGIYYGFSNLISNSQGEYNGKMYYQFNNVGNLHNTGIGVFKRVSSLPTNSPQYTFPLISTDKKGSVQFNTITNTFEGFDGVKWEPLH